ncbi:MAG: Ubiquinone/menaquinone biosynthesis C-methylase UbiE [Chloroflexi bacterium]|nr:MAG: Ubiquinone/menaquinone biosynthesis C-methylase UbiE [Chloroflexota bacterium]
MRNAWDKFAVGYDEAVTPFSMRVAEDALRRVDIRPGMRLLDVASGGGALSIPAARLGAQVLATDFSPAMVGRLNARALDEGLSNLESQVMDGHSLQLEDDTFDISASQLGIMLFPDRPRALGELARVTKPGGRALMVVFGPPPNVEAFAFFLGAMRATVPGFTPPQNSPLFSLQDPVDLRREMAAAELKDIRVETVDHSLEIQSGAHLWDMLTSAAPPIGALVADLTEEQKVGVMQALDGMLRQRSAGDPTVLKMQVHVGIGTK